MARTARAEKPAAGFKRCNTLSEEDLRKQLLSAPEYGFDQPAATFVYDAINKARGDNTAEQPGPDVGYHFYAHFAQNNKNASMLALPWRVGAENQLGKEQADRMHVLSVNLRRFMRESITPNDDRINPEKILQAMETPPVLEWKTPEAVPTLVQMLQVENVPVRKLMIQLLARIKGKEAGVALAQRAVFDLSAELREKAAAALKDRPQEEFKAVLLGALRSPWPAAADHAAETIAALAVKDLVPALVHLLKEPDPRLPYTAAPVKLQFVQEMVRLNHMTNCCLCHALSASKEDRVRGRVPTPGQELAPAYYEAQDGLFVRADTTYLRQDFSVVQPVANQGKWPGHQRFDYFIRVRPATEQEIKAGSRDKDKAYPQRSAVLFALRELTGRDLGDTVEKWLTLLSPADQKLLEKIIEKKGTETALAPMTDVHNGKATNALLEIVRKNADKGIKFQAVMLSEDTLKRINVVRKAGNLGLIRDNGKFSWPDAFTGAVKDVDSVLNADERKAVEVLTRNLVAAAYQHKPLDAKDLTKLRKQLEAAKNRMAFRIKLPQSDREAAFRFLDSFNEACVALEGKEGPVYAQYRKFVAGGKTVQELAEYLTSNGLRLAPGMPDDESAYRTLHAAIADFKVANASPSAQ